MSSPRCLQRLDLAFEAKGVDERTSTVEGLPRSVPAGQRFDLRVRLRDVYRNGLAGLEPSLCLLQEDGGEGAAADAEGEIVKVAGEDCGRGLYTVSFEIRRAARLAGVCLHGGGRILQRGVVEVRGGEAVDGIRGALGLLVEGGPGERKERIYLLSAALFCA